MTRATVGRMVLAQGLASRSGLTSVVARVLVLALALPAASPSARAGDAPARAVPTVFVDAKPDRPCLEQAVEQRLEARPELKAAAHACMKGRFAAFKQAHPEWFPVDGKPVVNRPK